MIYLSWKKKKAPFWAQQTEQLHGFLNYDSPFIPVTVRPGEPDIGARPSEIPQRQHAEDEPFASGDPHADRGVLTSAGTGKDSSIHCPDRTVFVVSERQEELVS